MPKSEGYPPVVFVGPAKRRVKFKHTAFKVISKTSKGIPHTIQLIQDDEIIPIKGGEEFITGYIPAFLLKE